MSRDSISLEAANDYFERLDRGNFPGGKAQVKAMLQCRINEALDAYRLEVEREFGEALLSGSHDVNIRQVNEILKVYLDGREMI